MLHHVSISFSGYVSVKATQSLAWISYFIRSRVASWEDLDMRIFHGSPRFTEPIWIKQALLHWEFRFQQDADVGSTELPRNRRIWYKSIPMANAKMVEQPRRAWLVCSFLITEVLFNSQRFGQQPPLIPESCKLSTKKWSRRYVTCTESDSGRLAHTAFHTSNSIIYMALKVHAAGSSKSLLLSYKFSYIILSWNKDLDPLGRSARIEGVLKIRKAPCINLLQ